MSFRTNNSCGIGSISSSRFIFALHWNNFWQKLCVFTGAWMCLCTFHSIDTNQVGHWMTQSDTSNNHFFLIPFLLQTTSKINVATFHCHLVKLNFCDVWEEVAIECQNWLLKSIWAPPSSGVAAEAVDCFCCRSTARRAPANILLFTPSPSNRCLE